MIIVSLTSWKDRIENVSRVVFSIYEQTIKPDLIELNLCTEEFSNKEKDLPNDLNILIKNKIINVNWVEKNTYTFKKIIPTIQKHYGESYYLLSIDDDKLYNENYIEYSIDNLKKYDTFCTSHRASAVIGGLMSYKSEIFDKDFWEKLTDDVIETKVDDTYIYHYLKYKKAKIGINYSRKLLWKTFNECSPTKNYYFKENRISKCEILSREIWKS